MNKMVLADYTFVIEMQALRSVRQVLKDQGVSCLPWAVEALKRMAELASLRGFGLGECASNRVLEEVCEIFVDLMKVEIAHYKQRDQLEQPEVSFTCDLMLGRFCEVIRYLDIDFDRQDIKFYVVLRGLYIKLGSYGGRFRPVRAREVAAV